MASLSSSSHRRGPVLDWIFGSKADVPSARKVAASQEVHGFVLNDDYNWLKGDSKVCVTFEFRTLRLRENNNRGT